MKHTRIVSLCLTALMACSVLLTSCGDSEKTTGVSVVVASAYVPDETLSSLQQTLDAGFSEEQSGFGCSVQGISSGDSESDPMMAMSGMMKLTSMIAAKEVDVLITNEEEGQRQANGESFLPLSDLFAEEELAGYELVSFEVTDEDGAEGDLNNVPCGIQLTDSSLSVLGDQVAVYVICNTECLDDAKEVVLQLAELYN